MVEADHEKHLRTNLEVPTAVARTATGLCNGKSYGAYLYYSGFAPPHKNKAEVLTVMYICIWRCLVLTLAAGNGVLC
jgi:hypothetical protein